MLNIVFLVVMTGMQTLSMDTTKRSTQQPRLLQLTKEIVQLHMEHCSEIPLCTIAILSEIENDEEEQFCCKPCSCNPECEDLQTCCPDYWIRDVIGNTTLSSYEEFEDTLNAANTSTPVEIPSALQNTVFERTNDLEECVSTFMITRIYSASGVSQRDAYSMISRCPEYFDDLDYVNTKNQTVRDLCEKEHDFDSWPVLEIPADTLVPVTSYHTGKSYKNFMCLKCNERGAHKHIFWTSWSTCRKGEFIQKHFGSPIKMFTQTPNFAYCNIVFKPPMNLNGPDLKRCNYADVRTCSEEWSKAQNDSQLVKTFEKACELFYNPIVDVYKEKRTVYNNIVCEKCNPMKFPSSCAYSDDSTYESKIEINFDSIKHVFNVSLNEDTEILDVQYNRNLTCNKGYIFDPVDDVCRLIYCPEMYFKQDGTCVPNAKRLENFLYSMTLSLIPTSLKFLNNVEGMRVLFEKEFAKFLKNSLHEKFTQFKVKKWRYFSNDVFKTYIIDIQFHHENEIYSNVLRMIQELMSKISSFQRTIDNRKISVSVYFLQNVALSFSGYTRQLVVERFPTTRIHTEDTFAYKTNNLPNHPLFQITRSHLCMRIPLGYNDLQIVGKEMVKITRTNVYIKGNDFNPTESDEAFLVCIKDLLGIDIKFRPRMFSSDGTSRRNDKQDSFMTAYFILGPLGIGLIVIFTWVCYKMFVKQGCRSTILK